MARRLRALAQVLGSLLVAASLSSGCGAAVAPSFDAGAEASTETKIDPDAGVDCPSATAHRCDNDAVRLTGSVTSIAAPAVTGVIRLVSPSLEQLTPRCGSINEKTVCIKGGLRP